MGWRCGGARRSASILLAGVLIMSGAIAAREAAAAPRPGGEAAALLDRLASWTAPDDPASPPLRPAASAPLIKSVPAPPVEVRLPQPGSYLVTLGGAGQRVAAAGGALALTTRASGSAGGARLRVDVLDQAAAARAGVAGFVFRLSRAGATATGLEDGRRLPLGLSVDYAGFGHAFGGGWADRLRVVALPACVLAAPRPAGCQPQGVTLPSRNDAASSRLEVDIADLGSLATPSSQDATVMAGASAGESDDSQAGGVAAAGTVLAVTAGATGETGNFAATPLSGSGTWQVAPGSGEFSWSYDVEVPEPPAGTAPAVALSYSSGAVDGLVSTRNTQAPQTGVGWGDFASAFVERRYTSCVATLNTDDLCWKSNNATISLNGRSSQLIPLDPLGTRWRLKSDPGWLVERRTGAANGDQGGPSDTGEHWRVTTPDGTQYLLGLGSDPDTGAATSSVWTVPVLADHSGEPCDGVLYCDQAWRWNLDRVVDPNGMVTTYTYVKETNRYLAIRGYGGVMPTYTRGGRLARIEYGKPKGTGTEVSPAGRVTFFAEYRCRDLNSSCPAPTKTNGSLFPDVPNDLICASGCVVTSPTFFSGTRYSGVRTEVRVGGAWRLAEQVNLGHGHLANSDGDTDMYLLRIQRVGLSQGSLLPLPDVAIRSQELPNRVDVNLAAGKKPMGRFRAQVIIDEYGGSTQVTYGQPNKCASTYTGPWDQNGKDCFPSKFQGRLAVFHKYVATKVEERDTTGGSPTMTTTYTYEGTPAWHHEDDEFVPAADQSWSDWRGYATTTVTQGSSRTRIRVFRGMHGDKLAAGGPRSVQVQPFDGAGFDAVPAVNDESWLAGAVLVEAHLGAVGEALDASLHEYEVRVTALPGSDPQDWAVWVAEARTTASLAKALNVFEQQRSSTTYNQHLQPETVYEEGWLSQAGDERCSRTTYAVNSNPTANPPVYLVTYPASVVQLAGNCSSTTELSHTQTYYDNATTLGAPPTKGNATSQRVRLDATRWVTSARTGYDAFGRVVSVTDARGLVTETAYEATPNGGYPRVTTVTEQVGGVAHTSVTEWLPEHGVPLKETDPNGNVTTYTYDGLGRLTEVRQPTEQPPATGKPPSWQFSYQVSPDKTAVPVVRSRQVQSNDLTKFHDAWVVYDSLMRQRQVQALSPEAGKVIAATTTYNDRGLVEDEIVAQAVPGTPGQGLLSATWENRTRTIYDPAGRVARQGWYRGGIEQWAAVSTYTHDTITVERPDGRASRSVVDGLGRTLRNEELDGATWRATNYGYDLADRLTSLTDPAGNRITYSYNLAGWRVGQDDPDAGAWSYGYDDAGNQTSVTDARGGVTVTVYDQLSRPVELRQGSATGALLARWQYDAPGEKGLLDRTVRKTAQGDWVVDVTGYDGRRRPLGTTLTVPPGVPGLSGSYTVGYGYDRADHVTSTTYPAVGGLPAETVATSYSTLGLPERMSGADEYVWAAAHDNRARPALFGLGPRPGGQAWMIKGWTYDADQRLLRMQTLAGGVNAVDHQFTYDLVGNVTSRTTQVAAGSWRECYGYDTRERLVSAYTTTAATCDGSQRGTGALPYDHTYTYTPDGNLATRVESGVTHRYTYPTGAGVDRPHAPTLVGGDSYGWDANGNLTSRTVGGQAETLAWDAERRLASVTGPSGTSSFLYDAGGARLLRTTPQGRTLYFADHEVDASLSGATVTATRSYSFGGDLIATRTPAGVDYLVTDQQDSVEASLPAAGAVETTRAYTPYGERRSGGSLDTDQGWIGEVEDDATDLSYLNARYYDPNIGRFISPDPLYDRARPQTVNPYSYGMNSPTVHSDPSGDYIPIGAHGTKGIVRNPRPKARVAPRRASSFGFTSAIRRAVRTVVRAVGRAVRVAVRWMRAAAVAARMMAAAARAARQHRQRMMLMRMHKANPDPGFWRALAKAGSGQALVLAGLRAINPDPEFWKAVHRAGSGAALLAIARRIENTKRVNAIALGFTGHGVFASGVSVGGCDVKPWEPSFFGNARDALSCFGDLVSGGAEEANEHVVEPAKDVAGWAKDGLDRFTCEIGRSTRGGMGPGCKPVEGGPSFMDIVGSVFSCIETAQEAGEAVLDPRLKAPVSVLGCAWGVVDPNPAGGP